MKKIAYEESDPRKLLTEKLHPIPLKINEEFCKDKN